MKTKMKHTFAAIDALVQMQDDGYGTSAIAETLAQLNRLARFLERNQEELI